ncbi:LytTR family transcriptional regulator DNA-binding domain-containing protein [Salinicoccus sp. ID82-1]|uniref:response regulator transcription factor n=1 Tax=Salinicoccus sp. ID82-1 TaxID=2820269 RepID=UPI001EFF8AFC|nr:response regulator transcription factor [Salinicoccus sp. ID82-1]MCG1009487.1 LytTR family transcriptional regulator DNA-binding domain-containing protein [Salinicoccus sp. ID82-1]
MLEIKVSKVIDKENEQFIRFRSEDVTVIQMPIEYIHKVMALTEHSPEVFRLESSARNYDRLTVKEQLKFYRKWYNSDLDIDNILRQFELEAFKKMRLGKCSDEITQRMSYIHALMSDRTCVLAVNPLYNATVDNIHLFHKAIDQMKRMGKAVMVVTHSTEDAFVISQDIMKLNDQGIKSVETEEMSDEPQSALNRMKAKSEDKTIFVDLEDIEYLESSDGKVYINISREKFVIEGNLTEAEQKLKDYGFYRCHRSYIVNLKKVKEIINWSKNTYSVVIDNPDKTKIPLSRTKYNEIQELLVLR